MNLLHLYFQKLGEEHQNSGKRLAEMLMLSCPDDYIGFIVVMDSLDTDTGEEPVLDCQPVLGSFLTYIPLASRSPGLLYSLPYKCSTSDPETGFYRLHLL